MSYIASETVTIADSTSIDSYRSVSGRSTIEIASGMSDHLSDTILGTTVAGGLTGATWKAVGAVDGTVTITPNHDVIKLQSSALQNPYAVIDTAYDWQITFNMQEVDLHNWALALGYNAASVGIDALDPNLGTQLTGTASRDDVDDFTMSAAHGLTVGGGLQGTIIKVESGDSGEIETFQIEEVVDTTTIRVQADTGGTAEFGEGTAFAGSARAWHGGSTFAQAADLVN